MNKPRKVDEWRTAQSDRRVMGPPSQGTVAGFPGREEDIEPTKGLHAVAILFRVLSGLMLLLMVMQVFNSTASSLEVSYGVLLAEAIRLAVFSGILWGAGGLVDLLVKSHYDLRAMRILLARVAHHVGPAPATGETHPGEGGQDREDALH